MHRCSRFAILLSVIVTASTASADVVLNPPGLSPGDPFRLVFITSAERSPHDPNISTYNDFVNDVANNLNGNSGSLIAGVSDWTAIGSTLAIDARDNTLTNPISNGPGVPIYSVSGVRLANDYADFWDGTLLNNTGGPNSTEQGTSPPTKTIGSNEYELVFTGTYSDGTGTLGITPPLGNSSTADIFGVGTLISGDGFADSWVAAGSSGTATAPFYGISGTLIAVPEPSPWLLMVAVLVIVKLSRLNSAIERSP